ncbi:BglG family transcription antiterminator LicT [Anaerobium acetethylicum]|uniref:Beta-glucoside operon transcriptional antiterminator n=1 Tax=Anaerobium acetethylicum TaxID=1619234 RepID=A0A1D3TTF6_9FIRM|nr:PRD domain-containing protein [Anaerobium acetethylicum]SCP97276.1 beta-glucoside operon transcriptional antiterminator [Anaerobium acetethylicum]
MRIEKVINNNVVSARDLNDREVVVMGKGIGFKVKEGCEICEDKIEKIFHMDNQNSSDIFKELLVNLPIEHIQVSSDIISYAKDVLNKKLNQNIYITLTDHINFAVERFKQGMMFQNPLLWEVQSFYRQEYLIGEYAVALIRKELGIFLPVDEVASIALHIVNAEYDTCMGEAMNITKMIPVVLGIVREHFKAEIDERTLHYERFITHLKFLAQRVVKSELLDNKETEFRSMIEKLYPEEYKCSEEIAQYIGEHFQHQITGEELAYLTVHIRRVVLADS